MPGILISYRRADAGGWAGRLFDSLKANLGRVRVFLDIDAIPPGAKFDEYIAEAVGSCEVLIALIGPRWLTPSDSGKRRLDDPNDFIRMEIATALARPKVTVIPVLVGKANMPNADELPDDIKPLARRQYYELSDSRWADDCRNLAKALTPIVYRRRRRVGAMIFAVFASVGVSFIFLLKFFAETCTSPPRTGPAPSARPSAPAPGQLSGDWMDWENGYVWRVTHFHDGFEVDVFRPVGPFLWKAMEGRGGIQTDGTVTFSLEGGTTGELILSEDGKWLLGSHQVPNSPPNRLELEWRPCR